LTPTSMLILGAVALAADLLITPNNGQLGSTSK